MKKITVASLALSASSSFALPFSPHSSHVAEAREQKTYCLEVHHDADGNLIAGNCDMTNINQHERAEINQTGCASGQIALHTSKRVSEANFPISIRACMLINPAQL